MYTLSNDHNEQFNAASPSSAVINNAKSSKQAKLRHASAKNGDNVNESESHFGNALLLRHQQQQQQQLQSQQPSVHAKFSSVKEEDKSEYEDESEDLPRPPSSKVARLGQADAESDNEYGDEEEEYEDDDSDNAADEDSENSNGYLDDEAVKLLSKGKRIDSFF